MSVPYKCCRVVLSVAKNCSIVAEKTLLTDNDSNQCDDKSSCKPLLFTNDMWGAGEYLKNDSRFDFVTDYLKQSEELETMRSCIKALSTPSSYEVVDSTTDLLKVSFPPSKEDKLVNFSHQNFMPDNSQSLEEKYGSANFCVLSSSQTSTDQVVEAKHDYYNELSLQTHRPAIEEEAELEVFSNSDHFSCPNVRKVFDCGNKSFKNVAGYHIDSPTAKIDHFKSENSPKEFNNQCTTKQHVKTSYSSLKSVGSSSKKSTESIINDERSKSPVCDGEVLDDNNDFSTWKLFPLKSTNPSVTNTTTNALTKTASMPSVTMLMESIPSLSTTSQLDVIYKRQKWDNGKCGRNSDKICEFFVETAEEKFEKLQDDVEKIVFNEDIVDLMDIPHIDSNADESDKHISSFIPKLQLSDDIEEVEVTPICNEKRKTNKKFSTMKKARPFSAGPFDKRRPISPVRRHLVKSNIIPMSLSDGVDPKPSEKSPKKRRPASAGKISEGLKSSEKIHTSPKRVWEKSSIAWDSYGPNQLRTWTSVKQPSSPKKTISKHSIEKISAVASRPIPLPNKFGTHFSENVLNSQRFFENMWTSLPDEILIHIFAFLDAKDLTNVALVCHKFHCVAEDCHLWKDLNANAVTLSDYWLEAMGRRTPKSVNFVNCNGKEVSNKGLRVFFRSCKNLQSLHISKCTGEILSGDSVLLHASCHCKNLNKIKVPWSKTTDNGLTAICLGVVNIDSLNINGNTSITDEAFDVLTQRHCATLLELEMAGCFAVSCGSLLSLLQKTENLTSLNVGLCSKITSDCVRDFCKYLKNLRHLDMHGVKSVTNNCLHEIANSCQQLCTLILSNCTMVSDIGIAEIATYLPTLIHLDICGCSQVTDQGIRNFVSVSKKIQYLDISHTGATHLSIDIITQCCIASLHTLKVSFCHNITQKSVEDMLRAAVSLKSLYLYGCKRLKLSELMKLNNNVVIEM
ncbi:unnamed protein product [Clavelina lepadiformis]|uniref:F-box domain-containing protein n=1 Tax=Clavelina lepadiformis TaxID=159417 RepID=A0ABP0F5Q4_CLALP